MYLVQSKNENVIENFYSINCTPNPLCAVAVCKLAATNFQPNVPVSNPIGNVIII